VTNLQALSRHYNIIAFKLDFVPSHLVCYLSFNAGIPIRLPFRANKPRRRARLDLRIRAMRPG
jgi:hypothetical protein